MVISSIFCLVILCVLLQTIFFLKHANSSILGFFHFYCFLQKHLANAYSVSMP